MVAEATCRHPDLPRRLQRYIFYDYLISVRNETPCTHPATECELLESVLPQHAMTTMHDHRHQSASQAPGSPGSLHRSQSSFFVRNYEAGIFHRQERIRFNEILSETETEEVEFL